MRSLPLSAADDIFKCANFQDFQQTRGIRLFPDLNLNRHTLPEGRGKRESEGNVRGREGERGKGRSRKRTGEES